MAELYCCYQGGVVGTIRFDESLRLSFCYASEWLEAAGSFPISMSLPLRKAAYEHAVTAAYFENLLPEESIRSALAQRYKIPEKNLFQFFSHFGDELAGALAIHSELPAAQNSGSQGLVPLEYNFIYDSIENGQGLYTQMLSAHGMKFSLAGAQEKFPVIYRNGMLFVPEHGQPTTHIIKADMAFRNSQTVLNEYLVMTLAQWLELRTAEVEVIPGRYPLLVIRRYDRKLQNTGMVRVHQEDFCQAQGVPSSLKYEDRGGPSFAMAYELAKRHSLRKIPDLKQLLKWLAFNLIVGNNDSHSKNLSFLWQEKKVSLAPFYDLLSTSIYGHRFDQNFAFKIGQTRDFYRLKKTDFEALEAHLGVRIGTFTQITQRLVVKVQQKLNDLEILARDKHEDSTIGGRLSEELMKRTRYLKSILG